jgi:hypothetical protein
MREILSVFIQIQSRCHKDLTIIKDIVFRSCSMPYNRQGTCRGKMTGQIRFLKDLEDIALFLGAHIHELLMEVVRIVLWSGMYTSFEEGKG